MGLWSTITNANSVKQPVILVLGDSLSAAYGIDLADGWVNLLQQRLAEQGYPHAVKNASVSAETTAQGVQRLPPLLKRLQPQVVILALGANDGLRGFPFAHIENNLSQLIQMSCQAGAAPLLLGMTLPPNYGPHYVQGFTAVYQRVAQRHSTPLVPFLLAKVSEDPRLMQEDQLHPNSAGQPILLDTVWPLLTQILQGNQPTCALDHRTKERQ